MKYKSVLLVYFSGTFHTAYLVRRAQEKFAELGVECTLLDVTDLTAVPEVDTEKFDLIGISYPVHGFRCPENMDKFIRTFKVKDKPYFVLKDSREVLSLNDASSLPLVKKLKKRGCTLVSEEHLLLPYNTHFRHDDRLVKQMLLAFNEKLPKYLASVIEGETRAYKPSLIAKFSCYVIGGLEQWGARLIGRTFKADDKCTGCALCAKKCPNHNIKMKNGKPEFGKECMICMRCIMYCPKASISIRHFLKGWEVNGKYDFDKILSSNIPADFITPDYKGPMAKSYIRYFFGEQG